MSGPLQYRGPDTQAISIVAILNCLIFPGDDYRVGNLAFLRPNNSILAFLFLVWP